MTRPDMHSRRADAAAWDAIDALHTEGCDWRAVLTHDRAELLLAPTAITTTITSGATIGDALATAATILGMEDHPAIRRAAQHAETMPAPNNDSSNEMEASR